jgi:hypothetical protein
MQREQLFTGYVEPVPVEAMQGGEFARSPLEGYVLNEMPHDLRRVLDEDDVMTHADLAEKQTALLAEAAPQIAANIDPQVAKITQLDLHFMFGGYIPAGKDMYRESPPELTALIQGQCARFEELEPFMTYEMIIDVNAAEYERTGNMRVYADGEDGQNERDFYLGHSIAEPYARDAAFKLHNLAEQPELYDAGVTLASVKEDLNNFKLIMGRYSKLSKDSFAYFRQFLAGYADGTRNASGAFMPSVQLLELAIHGPTEMFDVYLNESMPYFPQWSRPVMEDWHEKSARGVNITDQFESGKLVLDDEAQEQLVSVVDEFIIFRTAHLGITKAQIPGAFTSLDKLNRKDIRAQNDEKQILDPNYKGTAGFDVRNVLTNSALRLMLLRERLTGELGADNAPIAQ